ncbi:hypothetical protein CYMTET_56926 [Cymbomonas tetramitiformis]|uniref:Uncharacterized protein n=1 Tax=Cymbomonas tetramitiformis TaxID=36881 RepID=A0AAE0BBG4_9CHLO|nr:hypothetical protein CYMTET_56926 [Cymbomonas tetramitiformis]
MDMFIRHGISRSKVHVVPEITDGQLLQLAKGQAPRELPADSTEKSVFQRIFKFKDRKEWRERVLERKQASNSRLLYRVEGGEKTDANTDVDPLARYLRTERSVDADHVSLQFVYE